MHPLPADITGLSCEHGEVSRSVFDANLFDTYTQASFKPVVITSMIMLSKVKDAAAKLEELATKAEPRLK